LCGEPGVFNTCYSAKFDSGALHAAMLSAVVEQGNYKIRSNDPRGSLCRRRP
jgi:hypothetical protein